MGVMGMQAANSRPRSTVSLSERLLHGMGRSAPLPGCLERHPRMKGLSASMNLRLQTTARAGRPDAAFSEVLENCSQEPRNTRAGPSHSIRSARSIIGRSTCTSHAFLGITDWDIGAQEEGVWERVQLLERQLGVAVAEEDYARATRLRDQLAGLKSRLTPAEQFLLTYSARSRSGSLGQRMTAIAAMGELGDNRTLPVLLEGLRDKNPLIVDQTEKAMWKIFMRSGNANIDQRLQEGIALLVSKDGYNIAKNLLTEVIQLAPSFAEGYNKRATVNYLLEDYDDAIKDCQSTLELNPYHFGALSGMGLCYAARHDLESALFWFEKALALHPGLHLIGKYIEALRQKIAQRNGSGESTKLDDS